MVGEEGGKVRSVIGNLGVRREGDHWRCFDDTGDYVGKFETREAAMWGCWVTANDAEQINGAEDRLITLDDTQERACVPPCHNEDICHVRP